MLQKKKNEGVKKVAVCMVRGLETMWRNVPVGFVKVKKELST